jgi:hypothetical protein
VLTPGERHPAGALARADRVVVLLEAAEPRADAAACAARAARGAAALVVALRMPPRWPAQVAGAGLVSIDDLVWRTGEECAVQAHAELVAALDPLGLPWTLHRVAGPIGAWAPDLLRGGTHPVLVLPAPAAAAPRLRRRAARARRRLGAPVLLVDPATGAVSG